MRFMKAFCSRIFFKTAAGLETCWQDSRRFGAKKIIPQKQSLRIVGKINRLNSFPDIIWKKFTRFFRNKILPNNLPRLFFATNRHQSTFHVFFESVHTFPKVLYTDKSFPRWTIPNKVHKIVFLPANCSCASFHNNPYHGKNDAD